MHNKLVLTILSALLTLNLGVAAPAEASTHTTSSSSFKSGFSSQKKNSSTPSKASIDTGFGNTNQGGNSDQGSTKSSFGSFSKNSAAPATDNATKSSSALNKDLDAAAANKQALQTLDARNAAKAAPATPNPGYSQQSAPAAPAAYGGQAPVIINNNNGGSSNGWLWFMLGQSMSNHERTVIVNNDGNGKTVQVSNMTQDQPSFLMRVIRVFFWMLILGALAWFLYYLFTRNSNTTRRNYSLGKE